MLYGTHTNDEKAQNFLCDSCPEAFEFDTELEKHIQSAHQRKNPVEKPPAKTTAVAHMKPKLDGKYICDLCPTAFMKVCK